MIALDCSLQFVFLGKFSVFLNKSIDTINHLLHQLDFRISQSMLVGNVISNASLATRFSSGSSGLKVKLLAPVLKFVEALLGPSWEVDMDGGSHASAEVGGAGVDVPVLGVKHELTTRLGSDGVSHSLDTSGKTIKDSSDVSATLHGDDSQLVLFIDPGQEGLVLVVEDSTTFRPVTLHTSSDQIAISGDEEKVIVNQLLSDLLAHTSQGEVCASEVPSQVGEGLLHQALHVQPLLLGDAGGETEPIDTTTNSDPGGVESAEIPW